MSTIRRGSTAESYQGKTNVNTPTGRVSKAKAGDDVSLSSPWKGLDSIDILFFAGSNNE